MKIIKRLIENKTVKNAGWLVFGRILQMAINLFVGIIMARFLGPSNYGLINYASAYTGFFASFCSLGINSVLVRELINHQEKQGMVLGTSLLLKAVSSFLASISIVCIVMVIDKGETTTILVVALYSLEMIFYVCDTFNYWFQSKLQSKVTAIATFTGYLVSALYKVFLIATGKGVVFFALSTSLDYICVGIILILSYKKYGGQKLNFSLSYGKALLKSSWHFILPSLMVSVYAQTDKLMLKQMINEAELGFYSTAITICGSWCFVLQAIIDSFYPSIMRLYKNGDIASFEKINKWLYAFVFYISAAVSVVLCLFSDFIITKFYGNEYLPSVVPLRILTWYTAFSYLGVARNAWIVCKDKQKYLKWIYGASAVSNLLLNFILIPYFGASGAAVASLVTQIITTIIAPVFIKDLRPNTVMIAEAIILKGVIPKDFYQKVKNNILKK